MHQSRRDRILHFRNDALSQHLAQFDSPLVKRIDSPDRLVALGSFRCHTPHSEGRLSEARAQDHDIPWSIYATDAKPDQCAPAAAIYVGLCGPETAAL
jgi:hypothetical protein